MSKAIKKTTKRVNASYSVTVINMGKKYTAKGKSVLEALENVKVPAVAGKSIVIVESGKNKKERIIPHLRGRRTFTTMGMTREVQLKALSLMFDGI